MRSIILIVCLALAACRGDKPPPPDRKLGVLTPKLRAVVRRLAICTEGPLKDEVSLAAFDLITPKVGQRLAKRPLGHVTCPSTASVHVVYAADDNSLYRVSLSLWSVADARSVLDALQEAGLPLEVVEQGRRRLEIGGRQYEDVANSGMSADGAILLYVSFSAFDALDFFVSVLE